MKLVQAKLYLQANKIVYISHLEGETDKFKIAKLLSDYTQRTVIPLEAKKFPDMFAFIYSKFNSNQSAALKLLQKDDEF